MPPKLPGLYFDEVRGRYFPIKSKGGLVSGEREQKKRKIRLEREEFARQLKDRRLQNYQKHVSKLLSPVDKAFGGPIGSDFADGLEVEASLLTDFVEGSPFETYDLGVRLHNMVGPIVPEQSHQNRVLFATSTSAGAVLSFEQPLNGEELRMSYYTNEPSRSLQDAQNTILKFTGNSFVGTGLYSHMTQAVTTLHTFTRVRREGETITDIVERDLGNYGNVYDSVNLGSLFVVATGSSLQLCKWNDKSDGGCKRFKAFTDRSDILCLAAKSHSPVVLYAGTRNGWIYVVPIESEGKLSYKSIKRLKIHGARSIVSIKTTDIEGLIFVSAISDDAHQSLQLLDTMLPSESSVLASFQTSFSNVTRDQEIFEVTPDGRFLVYGSLTDGNGLGDFEVFSSHVTDNLSYGQAGKSLTYYPLNSLRGGYMKQCKDPGFQKMQLGGAVFTNYNECSATTSSDNESSQKQNLSLVSSSCYLSVFLKSKSDGEYYPKVTMLHKKLV